MKKVIVASKNPVKLLAAKMGFEKMYPGQEFGIEGISVPSGVADQPMSDKETLEGAVNRAQNAKREMPEAAYWIGIEGGVEVRKDRLLAMAWVAVLTNDQEGQARTAGFFLPPRVASLVLSGHELGHADDIVFGDSNSKQKGGAVGLLTHGAMGRADLYAEAVFLSLIPFKNLELFPAMEKS